MNRIYVTHGLSEKFCSNVSYLSGGIIYFFTRLNFIIQVQRLPSPAVIHLVGLI